MSIPKSSEKTHKNKVQHWQVNYEVYREGMYIQPGGKNCSVWEREDKRVVSLL